MPNIAAVTNVKRKHIERERRVSREIKFRAWDGIDECMFHQDDCYDNPDFDFRFTPGGLELLVLDEKWCSGSGEWESSEYMRSVDCAIFMQYTGLKDKNGVEIYEGDVVIYGRRSYEVIYSEPCFTLKGYVIIDYYGHDAPELQDWSEFEVIGNVYENPELLK